MVNDLEPFQIWVPAIPPLYICGGIAGTQISNGSISVTVVPKMLSKKLKTVQKLIPILSKPKS